MLPLGRCISGPPETVTGKHLMPNQYSFFHIIAPPRQTCAHRTAVPPRRSTCYHHRHWEMLTTTVDRSLDQTPRLLFGIIYRRSGVHQDTNIPCDNLVMPNMALSYAIYASSSFLVLYAPTTKLVLPAITRLSFVAEQRQDISPHSLIHPVLIPHYFSSAYSD